MDVSTGSDHDAGASSVFEEPERGFRVPAPVARPGQRPDFSHLDLGSPGALPLLDKDAEIAAFAPYHDALLRVMDDEGLARGDWAQLVTPGDVKAGLKAMIRTRAFDARMSRSQRQGKTSFYMQCLGEEAIGVGSAISTQASDMHFPTYRQQGILMVRGMDPETLMNQIYSNEKDPLQGRQMPVMYSSREHGFFSISGNLATQWVQAVGWGMASAMKRRPEISIGWIGDGATAEGDWHQGNLFASVYRPSTILCVVNNQWAISTTNAFAGADRNTFAARIGSYGLPALRVDGNDFLAVVAASRYAAARVRAGLGAIGIEFLTYRGGAHSTSDDPSKYRPKQESSDWPLGDPINRLRMHAVATGLMTEEQISDLEAAAETEMREAESRAEANGLVHEGNGASAAKMFSQVYAEMPQNLREQMKEAGLGDV